MLEHSAVLYLLCTLEDISVHKNHIFHLLCLPKKSLTIPYKMYFATRTLGQNFRDTQY